MKHHGIYIYIYIYIKKKICRQKISIIFNEICINEEMLPKYTYTHTHTHTHTHIYIYIFGCFKCVAIYIYIPSEPEVIYLGFT